MTVVTWDGGGGKDDHVSKSLAHWLLILDHMAHLLSLRLLLVMMLLAAERAVIAAATAVRIVHVAADNDVRRSGMVAQRGVMVEQRSRTGVHAVHRAAVAAVVAAAVVVAVAVDVRAARRRLAAVNVI